MKLEFDYGFGIEGLGGRIVHGGKTVAFFPDPERNTKPKANERKLK